jgi:hypothetical protein
MVKSLSTLACLVMVSVFCFAQQKTPTCLWRFQSINNVGLLEGQTGSAFQLQTINGARYQSWFAGLGLGLDDYRFRTIPLFMDIRKEFGKGSNHLFVYADGGISFSWVTDKEKMGYANEHFSNGFYDDFGLGYKTLLGKRNALQFSLGYSYKNITDTYTSYYFFTDLYFPGSQPGSPTESISYHLNRLSIKLGWSF